MAEREPFSIAGKRVLVTGGAGFLGRVLTKRLNTLGVEEIALPRSREFDLTSPGAAHNLFEQFRPDVVFHLAAKVGGIGANRANPGLFFYANLAMGSNVIEESRRAGVAKLVFVGTTCSYPKFCPTPFKEDDLWSGYPEETNAPYGIAKRALLVMLQAYREQYGLNGIYLIPANLYGPGDNFDLETSHVIPAMIRKFVEAQAAKDPSVTLWGTGNPTREFLYVDDCADGLLLAAQNYEAEDPVNLGTGEEISISQLAKEVAETVGFHGGVVWDPSRPDGQPRRRLDTTRARESFGFTAQVSLQDGLRSTADWFKSQQA